MAKVLAVAPDLFFASKIEATLLHAGHELEIVDDLKQMKAKVRDTDIIIVDLACGNFTAGQVADELERAGSATKPILAFYSHIDADNRFAAERAGFDMVVPRSRMAREMAQLVDNLVDTR